MICALALIRRFSFLPPPLVFLWSRLSTEVRPAILTPSPHNCIETVTRQLFMFSPYFSALLHNPRLFHEALEALWRLILPFASLPFSERTPVNNVLNFLVFFIICIPLRFRAFHCLPAISITQFSTVFRPLATQSPFFAPAVVFPATIDAPSLKPLGHVLSPPQFQGRLLRTPEAI